MQNLPPPPLPPNAMLVSDLPILGLRAVLRKPVNFELRGRGGVLLNCFPQPSDVAVFFVVGRSMTSFCRPGFSSHASLRESSLTDLMMVSERPEVDTGTWRRSAPGTNGALTYLAHLAHTTHMARGAPGVKDRLRARGTFSAVPDANG